MALEDCRAYMLRCSRCSYCKWIPFDHIKSWRFAKGCPSIEYGKFQSYSAGGRLVVGLALLDQMIDYTDGLMDIVYKCQMDGLCEISDKICPQRNNFGISHIRYWDSLLQISSS